MLELVQLGLTAAGAQADDPATTPERYADLAQKVFGLAEAFGCADLVETDAKGEFFPNGKLTGGVVREKAAAFAEQVFWNELVSRLASRDLRLEIRDVAAEAATEHEEKLSGHEDAYWREFERHSVDHLIAPARGSWLT